MTGSAESGAGSLDAGLSPGTAGGERRQATILFADMVGFTAISERLGEEDTFALMRSVSDLMATAIREQGGTVKDFTGDGLMALFGVPVAQEDATLRACRAALTIQGRLAVTTGEIEVRHAMRASMRIAINAGPVVVGAMEGGTTALGDTVNLASRLQALAEPGTVLLSETAYRLVEGLVEATPAGEHQIKGKAGAQKIFRLDALREGATRFDSAIHRGLTTYVGRRAELAVLERHLDGIADGTRAIDVVGEPGIGKSRLLHEFRIRVSRERGSLLTGNCSPDGQQTPYLPFIEVIRGSFGVVAGEAEADISRKLEAGLDSLDQASEENLGLLLNLLGLKAPEGALAGLDGTLIGLRTRDLLLALLRARCRQGAIILVMEDLHWIDRASEDLIGRILASEERLPLLIIHTRRPEYRLPWAAGGKTTEIRLAPLSDAETSRIVQSRLGVEVLPAPLARLVSDKAEGNALFAEELASFLLERGMVRSIGARLDYDPDKVAQALPGSVKILLAARVDRLGADDRALLQAASVIGRIFDPDLLASVHPGGDTHARLAEMAASELIHRDAASDNYVFKHALVQDVLYDSLLSSPRETTHRKIAAEIERRGGNRLEEVAEALAHHYERTGLADKAFEYLAMAGSKSLRVYSLDEAARHFERALARFEANPACADAAGFAGLMSGFTSLLVVQLRPFRLLEIVDRHMERLYALGDLPQLVIVLGNYIYAAMLNSRWDVMSKHAEHSLAMAERLGDDRSKACARANWILAKCLLGQSSAEDAERQIRLAVAESQRVDDSHLHFLVLWAAAWDCFQRGLSDRGRAYGRELQERGRLLGDPRALAAGLSILAWFDLADERYDDLLAHSVACLEAAITPVDQAVGELLKGMALVFCGQITEGVTLLSTVRERCIKDGWTYITSASDVPLGVVMVLQGDIAGGVRFIEAIIKRNQELGFVVGEDMARMYLTEIYLVILGSAQRPPLRVILKNFWFLSVTARTGWRKSVAMMLAARENPMFSGASHWRARIEANLGFLYLLRNKQGEARECLLRARPIAEQLNSFALLAKIDAALAKAVTSSER